MVRFALFGAGRIGRMHAENLVRRADARLLYVVDTKAEVARALAEPLGAKQTDTDTALRDPNVDAVLIATSTGFDREQARGFRLDIAAGTAVRFEPGQSRSVELVAYAGERRVFGFRGQISRLYRNDGGKFVDVAPLVGLADANEVRAASWGDYDDDGDADLFVGYARTTTVPNRLYRNDGGKRFVDVGRQMGVDVAASKVDKFGTQWMVNCEKAD